MKTRTLGAVMGIAALSGLLMTSPAQATDGVSSARADHTSGAGSVRATVDFVSRTTVVFRDFTVRDICPGDNLPVRARITWVHTDRTAGIGAWRADTNGCGDDGTNFGDITRSGSKSISKVWLEVCVYNRSGQNLSCGVSVPRDNQYT